MLSKIAGHWSASLLKTHDSTGIFRTLCYCKLTRFLCKWNIGRKRVNITPDLDSSYTSLSGVKEATKHCNKELHIWSCRRPRSASRGVALKNLQYDFEKFSSSVLLGFQTSNLFSSKPSSEDFIEHSSTGVSDVISTWLWRRKRLSSHRLLVIFLIFFLSLDLAWKSRFRNATNLKYSSLWSHCLLSSSIIGYLLQTEIFVNIYYVCAYITK